MTLWRLSLKRRKLVLAVDSYLLSWAKTKIGKPFSFDEKLINKV